MASFAQTGFCSCVHCKTFMPEQNKDVKIVLIEEKAAPISEKAAPVFEKASPVFEKAAPMSEKAAEVSQNGPAPIVVPQIDLEQQERDAQLKKLKTYSQSLDSLLIFAAVFSAIVTGFLVMLSRDLQGRRTKPLIVDALRTLSAQIAAKEPNRVPPVVFVPQPAIMSTSMLYVNSLWLTSLALALMAALGVLVVQQIIRSYSRMSTSALKCPLSFEMLIKQRLPAMVSAVPTFILFSVVLFLFGLAILLCNAHLVLGGMMMALCAVTLLVIAYDLNMRVNYVPTTRITPSNLPGPSETSDLMSS